MASPSMTALALRSLAPRSKPMRQPSRCLPNETNVSLSLGTFSGSDPEKVPSERETFVSLGRHLEGCRIGFDLGASDRKASAVIDGEAIYSEEVPWDPRNASDPEYHYAGVMDSIRRAAAK